MDVRCPQCATTFEFDERQLRAQLVTLKCSVCQHLFRLELSLPAIQESQHRWMVRQEASGDILYFGGFDVLHQWIMQRRISAQDSISRTGERWTYLADINEFAPIFQVVESINALSRGRVESAPQPASPPDRDRVGTMQQFVSAPPALRAPQPSGPLRSPAATGPQRALPPRPNHPSSPPAPQPITEPPRRPLTQSSPPAPRVTGSNPAISAPEPQPLPPPEPQLPPAPRTGPQRAVAQDDQWTIGDLAAPPPALSLPPVRPKPRRSALPLVLALLLIAALVAFGALWQLGYLSGAADGQPAQPAQPVAQDAAAAPDDEPRADVSAPAQPVPQAPQPGPPIEAFSVASDALLKAAQEAISKAEREAKRSDPKQLAKDAARALSREQYPKARELFHQSIQGGEATPANVTGLGWALLGLGNAEAAVAQFNKAIFLDEGFEDAYIGLGKAERQRGRLREAVNVYDRHLKRFPSSRKANISRHQRDQLLKQLGEQ